VVRHTFSRDNRTTGSNRRQFVAATVNRSDS